MLTTDLTTKLAEALRQTASAHELGVFMSGSGLTNAREALRLYDAAKAQPKQAAEPVAWIPVDALAQLKGPLLLLRNVPLYAYAGEDLAPLYAAPAAPAEPMNMALCEAASVVLREGQLYRFRRVGDCETCADLSKQSLEAYGQPPKEQP